MRPVADNLTTLAKHQDKLAIKPPAETPKESTGSTRHCQVLLCALQDARRVAVVCACQCKPTDAQAGLQVLIPRASPPSP
jgi:hypothetical protein